MVEVMIAVSVVAILALIAVATITKVKPAAEMSKLRSDIQNLNTAIKIYKHSGGDLTKVSTPAEVIAKLKTVRQKSTAQSYVGYTGSMLDPRLSILEVGPTYKGPRAIYDNATNRFSLTSEPVVGFKIQLLDLDDKGIDVIEETRAKSALEYSHTSSWVWDYEDVAPPARLDPTLVTKVNVATPTNETPTGVGAPTGPSAPVLAKLLPPTFSIPTDNYPLENFPMQVSINNPNGSSSGKIIYGIINTDAWEWLDYTGPIAVNPGDKVLAFVESLKPTEFHHSDPVDEHYDWTAVLSEPTISVSNDEIDARTGSTTVTITHNNHPTYLDYNGKQLSVSPNSFSVQYKLIPLVTGEGTETGWLNYEAPFDIGGPQFPHGFEVVSRVVSSSPNFVNSSEVSKDVNAFYKLDAPTIHSTLDTLTSASESAVITLTNPNPTGSSSIVYQVLDDVGNSASGWIDYSSPFTVTGGQYPKGFSIFAKVVPEDSYYRESGTAKKSIAVHFFGLEVTGKTIFILDSSGSMVTNNRIDRLKSAAITVLEVFGTSDDFAIIDYDSTPKVISDWGPGTSARKDAAKNAINNMVAGGGTMYGAALQAAITLNAVGADQIIFLSDGYPSDSNHAPIFSAIDVLVQGGIKQFDTISLGTDQAILKNMSEKGKGKNVKVKD